MGNFVSFALKKGQAGKMKCRTENPFYGNTHESGFFLSILNPVRIPLTMNNNLLSLE
jgi:hypothetical protein